MIQKINHTLLLQALLLISAVFFITLQSASGQRGQIMPFSAAEKQSLLNVHNNLRSALNAVTMPMLVWNDVLNLWSNNPNNCAFDHTTQEFRSNIGGYSYIGENLAWASANIQVQDLISGWGSEKQYYVYGPISLTNYGQVGHYTQQIWSSSVEMGCVRINCSATSTRGFIIACNYGAGGNFLNQYPYIQANGASTPSSSSIPSKTSTPSTTRSFSSTTTRSLSKSPSRSIPPTPSRSPAPACIKATCTSNSCGNKPDGCGGTLTCGSCSSSTSRCVNYVCVACTPTTTCSGKTCGTINDGCGNTISCGTCASGSSCQSNLCVTNPICKTCAQSNVQCGTITPTGCPKLDCGNCTTGNTCSFGRCVATGCNPACGNKGTCVNGVCSCYAGYSNKGDGNGCTPIKTFPTDFVETAPVAGATSNWVYAPSDVESIATELDMISSDSLGHKLAWSNAQPYESLESTKFSSQVKVNSASTIVGLGLRYDQGPSRGQDAIQYNIEYSSNSGNARWVLVWAGSNIDYQIRGSSSGWTLNSWHTIQLNVWSSNYSGTTWAVSQVYVDGTLVTQAQAVRPYLMLGGAYLYTQGKSQWKNVIMATQTSLRIAITNCMSGSAFAAMVASALGIPASNVRVQNITDSNGRCIEQATGKRQAALTSGSEFVVTLNSVDGYSGSNGLASRFTALAEEWNPDLADTGGITSVEQMPAEFGGGNALDASQISTFLDLSNPTGVGITGVAEGGGGGGLSGGAIAGIAVGSAVGVIVGIAVVVAIIAAVAALIVMARKRRSNVQTTDVVTSTGSAEQSTAVDPTMVGEPVAVAVPVHSRAVDLEAGTSSGKRTLPRGIDVFAQGDMVRHHTSIGGRTGGPDYQEQV